MANHLWDGFDALGAGRSAPFLVLESRRTITYADASEIAGKLSAVLVARGVRPGDRVAVQAEKSAEMILLYLACMRAGAAILPLNTAYTLVELEYLLSDSTPALIVCRPSDETAVASLTRRLGLSEPLTLGVDGDGSLMAWSADAEAGPIVHRTPEDLAAVLYTSGTTGRPKGAMLTHGNLRSNAETLAHAWRFAAQDVLLHALPIFHTHGLFVATNTVLVAGASILFMARFDADQVFDALPRATVMMGVPTFYVRLAGDARLTRRSTSHMRLFVSGSAPLLAETHHRFSEATGHRILERYGMTETNMITSNPYEGERRPGSVGPALAGVDVRIADVASGEVMVRGEIGVIEVRGPNVFAGYWRMPEKTAAEFRSDGFFITGDLGVMDDQGYVAIVGRGKDLIIAGGYNIYPVEVEGEIDALPGVQESAVIGVPHPDLGEGVVAVVVAATGVTLDPAAMMAALDGRLARFKQPRRLVFVDHLPRNAMAKVQKQLLRETYANLFLDSPPP
ncbi:MAG: malonyl-CoA synthase [Sphingomonadales bacterium 32-64-17]|nr:MAG: malonyl-CoA synthase [Sphingomonadales bacterium 32-64-17]